MSRSSKRDYALLLAAAFAWGSTTSQLAILAVVLHDHDMGPGGIALMMSAVFVAMVPATLLSGTLAAHFGARRTIILAALVLCGALTFLPFTLNSVPAATLAMGGRGLAAGLFTPAGQAFAQAQAAEGDRSRAVGMFTAMLLIPTFYGPALGQWSLHALGEVAFFGLAALPMIIALILACSLSRTDATVPSAAGYSALLRDRRLWLPNLATAASGLAYAFAFTFLPLLLSQRSIAVAMFFAPFAVVLMATRFVGLKHLQRKPAPRVVTLGLLVYAAGMFGLAVPIWLAVPVAGAMFAVGYGAILPTCVSWSTAHYPQVARARPVALINTAFNIGSIAAVQGTGVLLPVIGWSGVLVVLGITVAAVLAIVVTFLSILFEKKL